MTVTNIRGIRAMNVGYVDGIDWAMGIKIVNTLVGSGAE